MHPNQAWAKEKVPIKPNGQSQRQSLWPAHKNNSTTGMSKAYSVTETIQNQDWPVIYPKDLRRKVKVRLDVFA